MSVNYQISYGLVYQDGPGYGAEGYGSYRADNTDTFRPYQQKAANVTMAQKYRPGVIGGDPTVYVEPQEEDPVVTLLKKLVEMQSGVVAPKAKDAGFKPAAAPVAVPVAVADSEYMSANGSDYGSLLEFEPELDMISQWVEEAFEAVEKLDSLKKDATTLTDRGFGMDKNTMTDLDIQKIDELAGMLYEQGQRYRKSADNLAMKAAEYENAISFYAQFAEYLGLGSFEIWMSLMENAENMGDMEGLLKMKNEVEEAFKHMMRKKVIEVTSKEVKDASTQLKLDNVRPRFSFPYAPAASIKERRPRPSLRVNTDLERYKRYPGEQFNAAGRIRVEDKMASMNNVIPLRRSNRKRN